jgi:cold shock CspA family protein
MSVTPHQRIKGKIRHWDATRKVGSITAKGSFHLVDRTSAHSSTARQFRENLQVEFRPSESPEGLLAQEISID